MQELVWSSEEHTHQGQIQQQQNKPLALTNNPQPASCNQTTQEGHYHPATGCSISFIGRFRCECRDVYARFPLRALGDSTSFHMHPSGRRVRRAGCFISCYRAMQPHSLNDQWFKNGALSQSHAPLEPNQPLLSSLH
jgi:hypothetical protein